ncbi:MAG TPA: NifB/NifX family molybdenum-iron cluster-binding protein [Lachnospiraceae bacterium]|nr:NifB/NifX family molybdenum-iron cluster-binding protein [Lachnospiraceae bacterium]
MSYRIAVASTDGKVVNQHFGRAEQFLILEVDAECKYTAIELRELPPICQGGNHDEEAMQRNIDALTDCEYVLVSRIGQGAENALDQHGIRAYVIPDIIDSAVSKLISYVEINKLIYGTAK